MNRKNYFFIVFLNAETIMHFLTTQRPFSFIVFLNAKTILNSLTIQWPALWVQHFMLDALWNMKTFELMQFLLDKIFYLLLAYSI